MVFQLGLLLLLVPAILAPPPLKKRPDPVDQHDEFLEQFSNIFGGWGVPDEPVVTARPYFKPNQVKEKVEAPTTVTTTTTARPTTVRPTTVTTTTTARPTTSVQRTSSIQAVTEPPSTLTPKLSNYQATKLEERKLPQQVNNPWNQNPQFSNEQQKESQGPEGTFSVNSQTTKQQFFQSPPPQKNENFIPFQSQPPPNQQTNSGGGQPFSSWPPSECQSQEGNFGVCIPSPFCSYNGGESSSVTPGGCGDGLVCCVRSLRKCDMTSKDRVTNIKSPHYPGVTNHLRNCPAHIHLHPDTCQVRVDLLDFDLGKMINGRCHILDSLYIKSTTGAKIPLRRLCGRVSDPKYQPDPTHFYIDIPSPLGDQNHLLPNKKDLLRLLTFDFNVKNSPSSWNIRVTQIQCSGGSELRAPPGCGQYHTGDTGSILSLNFLDKQYPLGTRLDVCIKRSPGDCGVQYYLSKMRLGTTRTEGIGYGLVCDDYIMFRGEKTSLCGTGDGRSFILPASGPLGFTFSSDERPVDRFDVGYNIAYKKLQDCTGVKFLDYPKPYPYRRSDEEE